MNETEKRDRRDEKEEIRYHVIFYGQVQGVGFRYRAYYAAYQLGLTGWGAFVAADYASAG